MLKSKKMDLAAVVYIIIIITALKLGSILILPFLMAFFLFIIFLPLANRLNSFAIPNSITVLIIFILIAVIVSSIATFIISSGDDIIKNIPIYQDEFYKVTPKIIDIFEKFNISLKWSSIISLVEPAKIVGYVTTFFANMGNVLINILLTLTLVIFLFLESSTISKKALYFTKTAQEKEKLALILKNISRYFLIKTFTSLLTGFLVWTMLAYFNLQYALLFAVLAFLLNYIPSIGSFIASFPALFVAILQLNMIDTTVIAIGYVVINMFIGSFLDPKIMGKDLGLSTFIVFTSMVIWGWILGPMGMFLAVPLTIAIKIACENSVKYNYIAVILTNKLVELKNL